MLGQSKAQAPVPPVPPPPPREVCVVCAVSCGCFSLSKSEISKRFCQKSPRNLLSHLKIHDFWWIDRFQMCFIFFASWFKICGSFFSFELGDFPEPFWLKAGCIGISPGPLKAMEKATGPAEFFIEPPIFLTPPSCHRTWRTLWHGHDWERHAPRNLWSSSSNFWKNSGVAVVLVGEWSKIRWNFAERQFFQINWGCFYKLPNRSLLCGSFETHICREYWPPKNDGCLEASKDRISWGAFHPFLWITCRLGAWDTGIIWNSVSLVVSAKSLWDQHGMADIRVFLNFTMRDLPLIWTW